MGLAVPDDPRARTVRGGLYPVDRWGEYVTEQARPASPFFLVLTLGLTLFAAVIIVGHLIWGQIF